MEEESKKMKQLLKKIRLIFCAIILNGCGATLQTYKAVDNPNILDAMRTIRNILLAQPEKKAPSQVEVTENTLKIIHFVAKQGFLGGIYYEDDIKLINFSDIKEIRYHTKRNWFMVSLVNEKSMLFRYYSHTKADAEQLIDNIQALMKHKPSALKPIVLSTTPQLSPAEIKKLSESLESFVQNPNTQKFAIAEPNFLSALTSIEQVSGKDHTDVGEFSNSLAAVYQSLGKYEQAEPLYLKSLAIQQKALGKDDHVKVTNILDNLTRLYAEQGRFQKAEIIGKKSLAIKEKKQGKNDISVVISLNNLSSINQAQSRYERADRFNERSLSIMERVMLSEHINAGLALSNIFIRTQLTSSKNDFGIAKGFNQVTDIIALAIAGIYLTDYMLSWFDIGMLASEKRTKKIVNNTALASIYHAQGKYAQAEPLFKEVLEINKKELGNDHSNVANSLSDLAKTYYAQGKYKESEPLLHQAIAIHEKKLGYHHPTVSDDLNILALVHAAQNKYEQAKPLFQKSLRSINQSLNRWLWGTGEKTRLAYLQQQETKRDIYLSFYNLTNAPEEALYFSLTRKGLLLRISSQISALAKQSTDPSIKKN